MKVLSIRVIFDLLGTATVFKRLIILLALISLAPVALAQGTPPPVSVSFDFRNGALGWQAGFADYPPADDQNGFYQLQADIRSLPSELGVNGTGFYIQGANHSDDLFMFIRRRLNAADGIVAGQTYQVNFSLTFASNAQSGCGGAGGTPGEDVWLKAGASPAEPLAILETTGLLSRWLRMNVDIGAQSQGGIAASVTGNIANGQTCDLFSKPFVTVQRTHQHTSLVNANSKGHLWLLVGTDSGFEGLTSLYYQRIDASLVPVSQPPPPVLFSERHGKSHSAGFCNLDERTLLSRFSAKLQFGSTHPRNRLWI